MLNPVFSKNVLDKYKDCIDKYIIPDELVSKIIEKNSISTMSDREYRLQEIYTFEIWKKLNRLKKNIDWNSCRVMDMACGSGFLSYHLLKRITPDELHLVDINKEELRYAKELISYNYSDAMVQYCNADVLKTEQYENYKGYFDIIIGNSFLHHFYNLPLALKKIKGLLKPGGAFIILHEPTPSVLGLEGGKFSLVFLKMLIGNKLLDFYRYKGKDIDPKAGSDVWLFENNNLKKLFIESGFKNIKLINWHILRPFIVSKFSLHLSAKKPKLSQFEVWFLKTSILIDNILNSVLPSFVFGSISLIAYKNNGSK